MWYRIIILYSELCILSCFGKKPNSIEISASSSLSATIWRHRRRMHGAHKIMAPPKSKNNVDFFLNNVHRFHEFSTTYLNKILHLRYIKPDMS